MYSATGRASPIQATQASKVSNSDGNCPRRVRSLKADLAARTQNPGEFGDGASLVRKRTKSTLRQDGVERSGPEGNMLCVSLLETDKIVQARFFCSRIRF